MPAVRLLTLPTGRLALSLSSELPRAVTAGLIAAGTFGEPGAIPAVCFHASGAEPILALPLHGVCRLLGFCSCAEVQ